MRKFLLALLSDNEKGVNSTITCGISTLLVFFGLTIFAVARDPTIWGAPTAWLGWTSAASVVVGIVSAAKTAHSRWSSGAQSATVASPDEVAHVETKP